MMISDSGLLYLVHPVYAVLFLAHNQSYFILRIVKVFKNFILL